MGCVRVSVDVALVTLTCAVLMGLRGRFGRLNLNMQAQSVCLGVDAQLLYSGTTKRRAFGCSELLLDLFSAV